MAIYLPVHKKSELTSRANYPTKKAEKGEKKGRDSITEGTLTGHTETGGYCYLL
ncbi:hypothetical protein [Salinimonas sediminis]|uniref:hypothetical protein n=1 Tax=Salinimonas sediminis TaxID=2303538 RepID=UPI00147561E3|nr:hypothetical protein [Salinimonas sediminis]